MFRYRCPHCRQLLQALEMRAGKTTVCSKCSRPLTIPADRTAWLNEHGEPLSTPAPSSSVLSVGSAASSTRLGETTRLKSPPPTPPPYVPDDLHAPIVLGDDVVDLTSPEIILPVSPEPLLAPPAARKQPVYEAVVPPPPPAPPKPAEPPRPPAPQNGSAHAGNAPNAHPRRPGRVVATTAAPPRPLAPPPPRGNWPDDDDPDAISFSNPNGYKSQMDVAASLSMILSTRMKPAPEPPRDLKPSTAAWLLLTGLGIALFVLALVTPTDYLWWVGFVGAVQIAAGYVWIVWMTFRREWTRGVACAVPPVALYYLTQKKYARLRPLRFVLTGAAFLLVAALFGQSSLARTRAWVGAAPPPVAEPPADLKKQSLLVQLRVYREQRRYEMLFGVLQDLAKSDEVFSKEAPERAELSAELKLLCGHQLADVRENALAAYARSALDDGDAMRRCLEALREPQEEVRKRALKLLPKWKDTAAASTIASAVASRIGRPGAETTAACDALVEIGGQAAEAAAIPLLDNEDQSVRLLAINLMDKVGGPRAVEALRDETKLHLHQDGPTHRLALQKAKALQDRLAKTK